MTKFFNTVKATGGFIALMGIVAWQSVFPSKHPLEMP